MFGSKRARPPSLHAITFKENVRILACYELIGVLLSRICLAFCCAWRSDKSPPSPSRHLSLRSPAVFSTPLSMLDVWFRWRRQRWKSNHGRDGDETLLLLIYGFRFGLSLFRQLVRSGMIERHDLFQPELLLDYLLRVNEMLSEREMHLWELMVGQEEGGYVRSKQIVVR